LKPIQWQFEMSRIATANTTAHFLAEKIDSHASSRSVQQPICFLAGLGTQGRWFMKKFFVMAAVALTVGGLAACNTPGERAAGGALIGGAAGAAIGGLATGRVGGALVGGVVGAAGGAIVGAATAPAQASCPPQAPYVRYDAYGNPFCSRR
jgi:osmotically inducible lipoprotein OsmB